MLADLHVRRLDGDYQVVQRVRVDRELLSRLEDDLPDPDAVVLEEHPLRDGPEPRLALPDLLPLLELVVHIPVSCAAGSAGHGYVLYRPVRSATTAYGGVGTIRHNMPPVRATEHARP